MYFVDCKTVVEVRVEYRRLAHLHHPDHEDGDHEMFKALNEAYQNKLRSLDGETSVGSDDREHTYYYNAEHEAAAMETIDALLALKMEGVDILLIGSWVWCEGETRQYKEELGKRGLGLTWHRRRSMWYWAPSKRRRRRDSGWSNDELKDAYGVRQYNQKDDDTPKRREVAA